MRDEADYLRAVAMDAMNERDRWDDLNEADRLECCANALDADGATDALDDDAEGKWIAAELEEQHQDVHGVDRMTVLEEGETFDDPDEWW
jgi:hypothetical protein